MKATWAAYTADCNRGECVFPWPAGGPVNPVEHRARSRSPAPKNMGDELSQLRGCHQPRAGMPFAGFARIAQRRHPLESCHGFIERDRARRGHAQLIRVGYTNS
jgi:hypothetical protein